MLLGRVRKDIRGRVESTRHLDLPFVKRKEGE